MAKLNTVTTPKYARFRFVQDDSAHWYAIPADKQISFDAWVIDIVAPEIVGKFGSVNTLEKSPTRWLRMRIYE